ncbi:unnamed protein product [Linum trigynum]|uniref:Uncharacterized protein n=1 Tax=Linum trigynum TaxID=586398 RepID=A0AAV2EWI5_9ROSI
MRREDDMGGIIGEESTIANGACATPHTPEMLEADSLEANVPAIEDPIPTKSALFVKEIANQDPLLGSAIPLKWNQNCDSESSKDV